MLGFLFRFQGDDTLDPDLPTYFEAWLFQSRIGKSLLYCCTTVVVCCSTVITCTKARDIIGIAINLLIEVAFDLMVMYFLGRKSLVYLLFGTDTWSRSSSNFWTFYIR